jgi:hypothetical protein
MLIFKKEMRMILFKLKRRKTVILFLCAISFIIWNIPRHAKNTNNEIIQNEIIYNECGALCESSPGFNKVAIDSILKSCGELCDTKRTGSPGIYFDHMQASINCNALFNNSFIDSSHKLVHAPKHIPNELWNYYTMDNRLKVYKYYFDDIYLRKIDGVPVWSVELIDNLILEAKRGNLSGNYGISETNALRHGLQYTPGIQHGRVLIIGSETPWVEACVLEAGARKIVTVEYQEIISEDPRIETIKPTDFRERVLDNTLGLFDVVVSYSSVEHSGLGRYGDALNPWGDIIAVGKAWCVTKVKGSLTMAVMFNENKDYIRFNADRFYGKIRYPYLTSNWRQFYRGGGSQKVHIFTKQNK